MIHRMVDRRLWWALITLAVVAFSVQAFALKVLSTPRAVVAFDSTGRPLVFTDTHKAAIPDEGRVRAFVTDFLESYVGVDGHGFDARMVKALRMMTDEMRMNVVSSAGYKEFKAKYRGKDVTSRFEDLFVEVAPFDPEERHGAIYAAVIARQVFEGALGELENAPEPWVFMHMRIRRTPVSAEWSYGMLVEMAAFALRDTLSEAELLKKEAIGR
jgi:hypothetical protein